MPFFLWFDQATGVQGPAGKSAFELALEHGFPYNSSLSYYANENIWLNSLEGAPGPSGLPAVFTHVQDEPSDTWFVTHSFGFRPNVNVVDGDGEVVYCHLTHLNTNEVVISFAQPFVGIATLS
jgi:hypothetical protein